MGLSFEQSLKLTLAAVPFLGSLAGGIILSSEGDSLTVADLGNFANPDVAQLRNETVNTYLVDTYMKSLANDGESLFMNPNLMRAELSYPSGGVSMLMQRQPDQTVRVTQTEGQRIIGETREGLYYLAAQTGRSILNDASLSSLSLQTETSYAPTRNELIPFLRGFESELAMQDGKVMVLDAKESNSEELMRDFLADLDSYLERPIDPNVEDRGNFIIIQEIISTRKHSRKQGYNVTVGLRSMGSTQNGPVGWLIGFKGGSVANDIGSGLATVSPDDCGLNISMISYPEIPIQSERLAVSGLGPEVCERLLMNLPASLVMRN